MQAGLHLVHKPAGPTSFSIVHEWTDRARPLPVSHGGTLDPFAEGLLLVLVGSATRLIDQLHAAPKTYAARVAWGTETDTGDPLGQVVATGDPALATPDAIARATASLLGWSEQVPPATSAKKVNGERAYAKAHRGETVVLPPSRVYLHDARWPTTDLVELTCRGGFYVRAFVRDLGRAIGCPAHVATLSRPSHGPWRDPTPGSTEWIPGVKLLPWCPSRELSAKELSIVKGGGSIARGDVLAPEWAVPQGFPDPAGPVRGLHRGHLVATLRDQDGRLTPAMNLRGGL